MKKHIETLGKSILDVSNELPKDFSDKIEGVLKDKLKTRVSELIKDEELKIFKKYK